MKVHDVTQSKCIERTEKWCKERSPANSTLDEGRKQGKASTLRRQGRDAWKDATENQCERKTHLTHLVVGPATNSKTIEKINPEYSLEGLMLKMRLQYFDRLT